MNAVHQTNGVHIRGAYAPGIIYKEFGIRSPPEPGMKNPINYTIKKAMQAKSRTSKPFYVKPKNPREI